MRRERVPKEVWVTILPDGLIWKCASAKKHLHKIDVDAGLVHRYLRADLPSPSTVEKRLREAVVKAAMRGMNKKSTYEVRYMTDAIYEKSHPLENACARLELHLRATRKDAR